MNFFVLLVVWLLAAQPLLVAAAGGLLAPSTGPDGSDRWGKVVQFFVFFSCLAAITGVGATFFFVVASPWCERLRVQWIRARQLLVIDKNWAFIEKRISALERRMAIEGSDFPKSDKALLIRLLKAYQGRVEELYQAPTDWRAFFGWWRLDPLPRIPDDDTEELAPVSVRVSASGTSLDVGAREGPDPFVTPNLSSRLRENSALSRHESV